VRLRALPRGVVGFEAAKGGIVTLVVGVILGSYAMIAADSRETLFHPDQSEPTTKEDFEKVIETPAGLAAGHGLTTVVFPVIEELSKHPTEMTDPTEIAQYMRDFHGGFLPTARANPAYTPVRTLLDQVGWLVSSVEGGRVQLRMYHSTHEFEPMWYEEGVPGSLLHRYDCGAEPPGGT